MSIRTSSIRGRAAGSERDILAHWLWTIPILLVVSAFGLRQIDLFAPTSDEFYSMYNAGWSVNGPYSPVEIVSSVATHSPAHMPGYFMLLSAWGNLTAFDAALGRVLTIYSALLSLAISYRILYDFVSPVAGFFAVVMMASNAFFGFYISHVRMYPMMLSLAGAVLWLYLRLLYQVKSPTRTDYTALLLAVFALASTHIFSVIFFITLGAYHVIFASKNRVWWRISLTVAVALILVLPYVLAVIPTGVERAAENWGPDAANGLDAVGVWLTVFSNGQPLLVLFSLIGVALGHKKRLIVLKPYYLLVIVYLLALGLFAEFTPFIGHSGMRHQLPGWLTLVLVANIGLLGLYRFRRWLAIILLLWVVAGATFQMTADWKFYLAGRTSAVNSPPWHVLSRTLASRNTRGPLIGIRLPLSRISNPFYIGYSQLEHTFDRVDIDLRTIDEVAALDKTIHSNAITVPEFWVVYQNSATEADQAAEIPAIASKWQYGACETLEFGIDTVLKRYRWLALGCEPGPESLSKQNELINYKFHAARVDSASSQVFFVDEWMARSDDSMDNYNMSFQVISQDWENVAQLDLPMVHEGLLRQFSIDVGEVPKGSYRLVAIVYDKLSGRRLHWSDSDADPLELLPLAGVVLE